MGLQVADVTGKLKVIILILCWKVHHCEEVTALPINLGLADPATGGNLISHAAEYLSSALRILPPFLTTLILVAGALAMANRNGTTVTARQTRGRPARFLRGKLMLVFLPLKA
jgi:hypothetical protein